MRSADVGALARNVIPATATASLDLRLVLGNRPDRQVERVVQHIRRQGYEVLDRAPTMDERRRFPRIATVDRSAGYPAERTPLDHPLARNLAAAMRGYGPFVLLPGLGGSLPLHVIHEELGAPSVSLGLWNYDNNQHAEDENVRIGNLVDAVALIATVLRTG
jgi:acetylornithine deacetylase/succinyl-diaminopimelate desuccinylase-like protein